MKTQALVVAIAKLASELPPAGFVLLHHLIARGITEGTNDIETSQHELSRTLHMARDTVRAAALSLREYIGVDSRAGVGYRFLMPREWFEESKGIFTDFGTVEKLSDWPGNPPGGGGFPGHFQPENQATKSPGNQATMANEERIPGHSWPGNSPRCSPRGLETRPDITQNQQLTDGENADPDPDPIHVQLLSFGSIQYIACAKVVPPEHRRDAVELQNALQAYHQQYAPKTRETGPVPAIIIARCLAVASLGELLSELKQMRIRGVRAGSSYGWYPSVFAQRLKGIPPNVLRAALEHFRKLERQRPQANLDFSTRMTADIRQQMRRIS
jgi:hypothetical protein